ncbi:hypothetical protein GCK32_008295 [Trichostrongylus colubriformis]|uniref:Uncharacterized protein n=1 Tax=Trichostrongylus colubriformis TaxID=6319 RepID=A0AAN8FNR9_TRICO
MFRYAHSSGRVCYQKFDKSLIEQVKLIYELLKLYDQKMYQGLSPLLRYVKLPYYLCKPSANIYDIEFTRLKIRDLDIDQVLFEREKPAGVHNCSSLLAFSL